MIKETNENLFNAPAQIRCVPTTYKSFGRPAITQEALSKYPSMAEEFETRCKLWGKQNMGDVFYHLSTDGTVCAMLFADTDDKMKLCLKSIYTLAVRYNLSVAFPVSKNAPNWKTTQALINLFFKEEHAPILYLAEHNGASTLPAPSEAPQKETPSKTQKSPKVDIFTDGACSGNPGPGGWAAILIMGSHKKELVGGAADTTNNQMELSAPIAALQELKRPCDVTLYSDSQYLINAFEKGWLENWQKNGWKRSDKKPVQNVELWKELITLTAKHTVKFVWVKGHADNEYINRCDELAVEQSHQFS